MHSYHGRLDKWKGICLDKGQAKNQPHQIIQTLHITALKFNSAQSKVGPVELAVHAVHSQEYLSRLHANFFSFKTTHSEHTFLLY